MRKLAGNSVTSTLIVVPAIMLAATLTAACGDDTSSPAAQPDPPTGSTAGPQEGQSTLTVTTQVKPGRGGIRFVEGAVPEVTLVDDRGDEHRGDLRNGTFTFPGLTSGTYSVKAALRPCDGNCGYLDPPVDECRASLEVTKDLTAHVRWRSSHPCRVTST